MFEGPLQKKRCQNRRQAPNVEGNGSAPTSTSGKTKVAGKESGAGKIKNKIWEKVTGGRVNARGGKKKSNWPRGHGNGKNEKRFGNSNPAVVVGKSGSNFRARPSKKKKKEGQSVLRASAEGGQCLKGGTEKGERKKERTTGLRGSRARRDL